MPVTRTTIFEPLAHILHARDNLLIYKLSFSQLIILFIVLCSDIQFYTKNYIHKKYKSLNYQANLMNKQKIKKIIAENNIEWLQIHFTDILGGIRAVHFPSSQFESLCEKGFRFDGSSVGFRVVEKSDMVGKLDLDTFMILPHINDEALIRADLCDTKKETYRADPRNILKKAIKTANSQGYDKVAISPEMEFSIFDRFNEYNNEELESRGYFVAPPIDNIKEYRKSLSNHLIKSGYEVKYHHHEKGKFQHEIEVRSMDALSAADFCLYFKYLAREITDLFDLDITFMPKPLSGEAGNGMHAHICLFKGNKNKFFDDSDKYNLSQDAHYFIGGLLDHARGLAAIANPTLNSYKRLIPYFEAPIYIAWAQYNRTSLIRIPAKKDVDIEIRNADPAANPYLFFTGLILAGLDGIKKKISYEPVPHNIYKMSRKEIKKFKIKQLPTNLMEALEEFENDSILYNGIGKDAADLFIDKKKKEWHKYMDDITDLDYRFYFNC
ncbi:MAG: type I glutamate--ammonia ligase [Candidatus Lokiarchaeota archaeon]|nr:type I glutamate--ammonia ligase [Candidatus Lokiarchaeota archaeon]